MPTTVKRVLGDYEIQTANPDGSTYSEIVLRTEQVRIYGDLIVTGDQSVVTETNLAISDNEILLNEGESGAGVTAGTASITVDRGSSNNVGIRWNESTDMWQLTTDGASWEDILSSGVAYLENIVEDTTPQLGGDLDVNSRSIVSTSNGDIVLAPDGSGTVKIESAELALDQLGSDPSAQAGYNLIYHKAEGSGGTGLYFKTSSTADELVSKSKAIVYGIIF